MVLTLLLRGNGDPGNRVSVLGLICYFFSSGVLSFFIMRSLNVVSKIISYDAIVQVVCKTGATVFMTKILVHV